LIINARFCNDGVEKFDKAVELFFKSIEIEQNSDVYMDLGNAYASMGEYDNAVDAFSKASLLDQNNGEKLCVRKDKIIAIEFLTKESTREQMDVIVLDM
jgi:hypothetical protein